MPETTTAADLEAATKEAEDAQAKFLALEFAALHNAPEKRPSAAEVVAQRTEADHAARRVEVTRKRLEAAREAARVEAMHAVGARVSKLAAAAGTPSAEHVAQVRQLAELAAAIRTRASAHDAEVRGLYDEATALHGDPRHDPLGRIGQKGAWAAHVPPMGVKYGSVSIHIVGGAVDQALELAIKGDVDGAMKRLAAVQDHTPQPPREVFRDTVDGSVYPVHGNRPRWLNSMVSDGRAIPLSADELQAWMDGGWQR